MSSCIASEMCKLLPSLSLKSLHSFHSVLDHPEDVRAMVGALRELVERGTTVVVADQHPMVRAAADWVVDLAC